MWCSWKPHAKRITRSIDYSRSVGEEPPSIIARMPESARMCHRASFMRGRQDPDPTPDFSLHPAYHRQALSRTATLAHAACSSRSLHRSAKPPPRLRHHLPKV